MNKNDAGAALESENLDIEDVEIQSEDEEEEEGYIKLDYSLETPEERNDKVKEIIDNTPPEKLTPYYLDKMAKYILDALPKEEKKKKEILTDNHMVTVNKRETSFEGLVGKMSGNENSSPDTIYNMITNDKNVIFSPKVTITDEDVAEVPGLADLRDAIQKVEKQAAAARGKKAFELKKQLIQMRQDQYVLKTMYRKPIHCVNLIKSFPKVDLSEEIGIAENGKVASTGLINFYDEKHVSALLCNYSKLKEDSWSNFTGDAKWLLMDFEKLVDDTLKDDYPLYYDLVIYKIDGRTNEDIQLLLEEKHGIKHSEEYISSLWRNKIPKLIVKKASEQWLEWHYTMEEKGKWKKCSCCGQIKLANNYFFSKNSTSKDGYYSICKECRNKKYLASKNR